jgi:hypothetical protein
MHRDMRTEDATMHAVQQQQYIKMCHERWSSDRQTGSCMVLGECDSTCCGWIISRSDRKWGVCV